MKQADAAALRPFFAALDAMQADMGGTELRVAYEAVCAIPVPKDITSRPCVLLITDALVWDEAMRRAVIDSGHRLFAIGVGSAPAENLLRDAAEASGGACVFISPREDAEQAVSDIAHKIRAQLPGKIAIAWSADPVWQSRLPSVLFDGNTVHAFAQFNEKPTEPPTLIWERGETRVTATPQSIAASENADLTRLGGARMAKDKSPPIREELGVRYQLLTDQTAFLLVHAQEDGRIGEIPTLHQVKQMMAAGSHGYGSVMPARPMASPAGMPARAAPAHADHVERRHPCVHVDSPDDWDDPFGDPFDRPRLFRAPPETVLPLEDDEEFFEQPSLLLGADRIPSASSLIDHLVAQMKPPTNWSVSIEAIMSAMTGVGALSRYLAAKSASEGLSIDEVWAILLLFADTHNEKQWSHLQLKKKGKVRNFFLAGVNNLLKDCLAEESRLPAWICRLLRAKLQKVDRQTIRALQTAFDADIQWR
jgi:hypothetical protein